MRAWALMAWMLWMPAVGAGQEISGGGLVVEDEVASDAVVETAVAVAAIIAPSSAAPPARRDLRLWAHAPGIEGLALLVRPGRSRERWRLICELPCEVTPMPGVWDIAVRPPGAERPLPVAGRTIELRADGSLELRYASREWIRIVGGVLLGVGLAGIVALAAGIAVDQGFGEPGSFSNAALGTAYGLGVAIGGVLTLAGLGMLGFTPIARVRWVP